MVLETTSCFWDKLVLGAEQKGVCPSYLRSGMREQYDFTSLGSFNCCVSACSALWFIV